MARHADIAVTPSSGNVFADMGFADPGEELTRAQLASPIQRLAKRRRLTQVAAARLSGNDSIKDTRKRSAAKTSIKVSGLDELREPPTHPGEILLEEFLKPKGVTQVEAARHLGMSTTRLNEIIRGKRGISADTAWRLGDWLATGPEIWMDLQSKWDLWHARKARESS